MGKAEIPGKETAKLFTAVMYSDESLKRKAFEDLGLEVGSVLYSYGPIDFTDFSEYYNKEMGKRILKSYYVFKGGFDVSRISQIKLKTNSIENRYAKNGERKVNLDPGYVTSAKLVLATTKNFSHRVYLRDGIYGEVTLWYSKGLFHPFEWTYPDYRDAGVQSMLLKARGDIAGRLRKLRKGG